MLMGLLFAGSLVVLLRMIQPEQLLRVESLPDITDFFADAAVAGHAAAAVVLGRRGGVREPAGRCDWLHLGGAVDHGARR